MSPVVLSACAGLLALSAAATSLPACAAEAPERTVAYRDLNLTTDAGARELLNRLERAAAAICEVERFGAQGLDVTLRYQACVSSTVDQAVGAVGVERLTALHTGKAGRHRTQRTLTAQR